MDPIAERIQLLVGVSIAMAADVAVSPRLSGLHAAKRFQSNFHARSTPIRSLFVKHASWLGASSEAT
jgi:hypothetical protein